jgi:drug/metabolite transporter, DME family
VIGELAALGCALTWAVSSILLKRPVVEMGAVAANLIRTWVGTAVFWAVVLATGRLDQFFHLSAYTIFALVVSMIIGLGIGDTLYFRSLQLIGVSRALPISGSYPLPTLVLAAVLLGEPLGAPQVVGTLLIVASVYLLSLARPQPDEGLGQKRDARLGVALAIVAALLWALSTILLKSGVEQTEVAVANSLRLPAAGVVLFAMGLRQRGGIKVREFRRSTLAILVLSGVIGTAAGSALYLTSVIYAGAAKAAALQSVSPFFAAPLAFVFLRERPSRATLVGTLLSVVGVWLLVGV